MPDLNLANSRVRDEIEQIMKFWLDKGAAGFRLDAAKEFYSGNMEKNLEVLNWIQQTATALKPDCYLVAEVWDNFNTITKYYASDITSIFNYAFGNTDGKIIQVLRGAGNPSVVSTYATALEKADTAYRGSNEDYIDAPFLSNHDIGRIAGFVSRDEARTKLAGAMNLFMSGSAFIYYGEEIGMVCGGTNDPSFRAPMYWNEERNEGTTNMPPECTLPEEYPFGSLEEQKADGSSIYNYYRHAIAIRNALPVISHGKPTAEAALNADCVSAYRKTWGEDSCIILMNINGEAAEVDLSNYTDWTLAATLTVDKNAVTIKRDTLKLPAYGTAVLIQE
jgi:glycosidase